MKTYVTNTKRWQIVNIFSQWRKTKSRVPQSSILGPLLFNIFTTDLFCFLRKLFCSFPDQNTLHSLGSRLLIKQFKMRKLTFVLKGF